MDDDYGMQDTSTYTDTCDSNSYKNPELNHTYEIDRSNDLSFTRDKDYSSSSEQINSQTNIFSNNNENSGDNTKLHHPSDSQRSILDETNKHSKQENYDSEHSNIQNDEYLLNINQHVMHKDDHANENTACCTSNDSMVCLDACCTCFCL